MTTVIPFKSEMIAPDLSTDGFEATAEGLRARRSELALLETRCGEDALRIETGWTLWLLPASVALLAVGFGLSAPLEGGAGLIAAIGFGIWAAGASDHIVRSVRQAMAGSARRGKRFILEAGAWAAQAAGAAALASVMVPAPAAALLLASGAALGLARGWIIGACDPRAERLREDLEEARADLFAAEAQFERTIETARAALDEQIERARKAAGQTVPDAVAAE